MSTFYKMVEWAATANIYEVNIRQYSDAGTFRGFQTHLARLSEMGVKILWLMPITLISEFERQGTLGSYYACSSYTEINPEFGNASDFKNLVAEAHSLGMKIMIDWVANHTGYRHEWALQHPEWYQKNEHGDFTENHGWTDVIDLDYHSHEMRIAMINAMQYWVKAFNIDGFRCDMAHLVPLDFWHSARKACEEIKPLFWLGECDEDNYSEIFDATYTWRWMHAIENFIQDAGSFQDMFSIIQHYNHLPAGALKMYFTSNHDENSWNGTEYEKYGKLALPLAVFTQMVKGIPLIYSGQELPNLKRLKFFEKDIIEWHKSGLQLHGFYKQLLQLRNFSPAFESDAIYICNAIEDCGISITRRKNDTEIIALFNFSDKQKIQVQSPNTAGKFTSLCSGVTYNFNEEETFELLPCEYLMYVK